MPERNWLQDIYQQHQRELFLTALNVLQCSNLAEDAVHTAFVQLAESGTCPDAPKLYAFSAVRNAAIDILRRRARRQEETISKDFSHQPSSTRDEITSLDLVQRALAGLDQRSREVIELHLKSDLTFHEIASICDEPLQTVASRYRRGLEKIRHAVEVCHE